MTDLRPWHRFYGRIAPSLDYPEVTLYEALAATARRVPGAVAWDFFGTQSTYAALLADVDRCASGLAAEGLRAGDRFLISMPTSPPAKIVLARISDDLPLLKRIGFRLTKGRKIPKVPAGQEGEICVAGPAVMLGYLNDPIATAHALRVHADGLTWLHTGDLGRMDADGFFYFSVRLKRMIKSSGFNVYPAQVERVAAFVVLRDPSRGGPDMEKSLVAHCRERLIKWSCPREVAFADALPLTKVGKVDYRALVRRHAARSGAVGA